MSTPSGSPTLGFVGLGSMGSRIAARLLAAGNEVYGWNRTPGKSGALVADGLLEEATPGAVAQASDVVLSMVTDTAAVEEVHVAEMVAFCENTAWRSARKPTVTARTFP